MKLMAFRLAYVLAVFTLSGSALASPVRFDDSWKEQGFLRLWSNDYTFHDGRLEVRSEGAVSLLWRDVEPMLGLSNRASWSWKVDQGVAATDLGQKGGDDRNLALYFVFADPVTAARLTRNSARSLLRNPAVRILVYIWGGDHEPGAIVQSPYHPKLVNYILRPAGTGAFTETVDLEADFKAAFDEEKGVLVGLGVSADSDDTEGRIMARVENLELLKTK